MEQLLWPIALLSAGLLLIILELFVPSGGVISLVAALCIVAGVGLAFSESTQSGLIMLGVTVTVLPVVLAAAVKWWPHTPIGKLILIGRPESPDDVLPQSEAFRGLQELVGRRGRAATKMMPGGIVDIAGRTYDAISEGMPIDDGEPVQVVTVRTHRLVVRPVSGELPADDRQADDTLQQPLDAFGIEDWRSEA